jgi:hypothetical protein
MTPRRVIEDSDEDDGSFGTPELLNPFPAIIEVGSVPKMQPSSTGKFGPRSSSDSVLQAEKHYNRLTSLSSCI